MVLMAEEKGDFYKMPQKPSVSLSSCANFHCISVRSTYQIHKHPSEKDLEMDKSLAPK